MQINYFMSKSRRFHIELLGDSIDECIKFPDQLRRLQSIKSGTIITKFHFLKNGTIKGFISCRSSNNKKFKIELEELINEYEKDS